LPAPPHNFHFYVCVFASLRSVGSLLPGASIKISSTSRTLNVDPEPKIKQAADSFLSTLTHTPRRRGKREKTAFEYFQLLFPSFGPVDTQFFLLAIKKPAQLEQISIMPRRKRVREPKGETTQINFIIGRNYCAILFNFSMLDALNRDAMFFSELKEKRKTEEKRNEAQSEEKCNKWSRSERETANMSPA
jgi:hypothetical protein